MKKIPTRIWGVCLSVIFWCARLVFTLTRVKIRGALVIIWNNNKILLIHKSYRNGWSIPGGLLKRGETRQQAAVRETDEEVGIALNQNDLVLIKDVPGDFGPNDRTRLFEVVIVDTPEIKIDEREISKAEFVTPQEALERDLYHHVRTYLQERARH